MTKYDLEDFDIDTWEDPIVAEVRAIREAHTAECGYDLNRIFEDLRSKRKIWEEMGFKFVTAVSKTEKPEEPKVEE